MKKLEKRIEKILFLAILCYENKYKLCYNKNDN